MTDPKTPTPAPYICPRCQAANKPGASPTIVLDNGTISCQACGHAWTPAKPPKDAA